MPRGRTFAPPDWWLSKARKWVGARKGLVTLGRELAELEGRGRPYSHSVLSRFAAGLYEPTQGFAEAVSKKSGIPRPFFIPRTEGEAKHMESALALADEAASSENPVRSSREETIDEKIAAVEREVLANNQTDDVPSDTHDEGTSPLRRRAGRVGRGGKKAS